MQLMEVPPSAEVLWPEEQGEPVERTDILVAGRNCWRVERSRRAAVLVDGADYFRHLEAALRNARRSIQIIGWDFDARIRLRQDVDEERSPPLGTLLRTLVESNPSLTVDILVWSFSVVHGPGEIKPMLFGADWQNHPRIRLKLDTFHPFYAAHHQKIVCIDGKISFVGGIDLTVRRWDERRHLVDDPTRVDPDGNHYPPLHDIQMAVDGDAAAALCALARDRFERAGVPLLAAAAVDGDPWPNGLVPDFWGTPVGIARTRPAYRGQPEICEAQQLNLDAIAAARHAIYIEAQYMTAGSIGKALAAKLEAEDGPEVIVIMTHESRGFVERVVMGSNRDRLIRRLVGSDRHGRLRIYFPVVPSDEGERQVLVHSKLIVVDDSFMRIGSSNLNNRSIGLDTECDLAVEGNNAARRRAIAAVRDRLLAEHLGCSPATFAAGVADCRSVIGAIDRFNTGPRGLRPFEALTDGGPSRPVFATAILDPKRPFGLFR